METGVGREREREKGVPLGGGLNGDKSSDTFTALRYPDLYIDSPLTEWFSLASHS